LLGLEEVIVTPHLGASTSEARVCGNDNCRQVADFSRASSGASMPAVSPEALEGFGYFFSLKLGSFQSSVLWLRSQRSRSAVRVQISMSIR
jgi:hypothetical protein